MCRSTKMWVFCDKCASRLADTSLKECDYCGDYFCNSCARGFESVLCCAYHGEILDFCRLKCMQEYREMYWKCDLLRELESDMDSDYSDDVDR